MRGIVSRSQTPMILITAVFLVFFSGTGMAQTCTNTSECVTIMHTNDMHSKFLASPNADYTPGSTGDDSTTGGIARIATKVGEVRTDMDSLGIPVLLLDGGDFSMGTLFHLLRGEAEMGMMNYLGYDAVTLGNHEFDLLPTGAASAVGYRDGIRVVATNLEVLDDSNPWGAAIQGLIDSEDILPWTTQDLPNGLKVGYFGIMGEAAWEDVNKPYGEEAYPLGMRDRFAAAEEAVSYLRDTEEVDIVICLSHSGVNEPEYWTGEDVDLAAAVPGIDVIISGHTHTLIPTPVTVGTTTIVQAKSYTQRLGVLEMERVSGTWTVLGYDSVVMDDMIPGDAGAQALVDAYIAQLDSTVLAPDYAFNDAVAETDFDMKDIYAQEHGLGNLITDSIRWSVENATGIPVDVAIEAGGVIRANLLAGTTGAIQTSDAFEVLPLGIDPTTDQIGYPLLTFCMYGDELHNVAWVNALAPYVNDTDLWLSWSGAGFQYVDYLPPLSMWKCLDPDDPECESRVPIPKGKGALYRVAVNSYVASNVGRLEDLSYGLIKVFPRDCSTGNRLASLDDAVVYEGEGDPLMEWEGFLDFLAQFPDTDEPTDGIPNIPARYAGPEGRMLVGCVVATAAYGSPLEEKVGLLRDFRDRILMKSQAGKKFVSFYYAHGVPVAKAIAQSEWLKAMVRVMLLPLIGVAKLMLLLV
jgi:5'-nucleotidase/UDP-sugar diphosphatase